MQAKPTRPLYQQRTRDEPKRMQLERHSKHSTQLQQFRQLDAPLFESAFNLLEITLHCLVWVGRSIDALKQSSNVQAGEFCIVEYIRALKRLPQLGFI